MGAEPIPTVAPAPVHFGGPPDDLSPRSCRLRYRPRDIHDCGVGPWHTHQFESHERRAAFVTRWQHDFEMSLG